MAARKILMTGSLLLALACGGEKKGANGGDGALASTSADSHGATLADPRASIFVNKGCPQCHSISGLGVKSPAEIGPDLTMAYEDVQTRFSMSLADFLHNPTGTMQMVLSSQIQLSTAERDSIIHILKELHEDRNDDDDDDND